jgi:hypothetical protein
MTVTKPIQGTNALSSKQSPKRPVSVCSSCKFDPPSQSAKSLGDMGLQSTDRRRRYMRRGSKSPTMLKVLQSLNLEKESDTSLQSSEKQRRYMRRGSKTSYMLATLPSLNLEKESTTDHDEADAYMSTKQERRLSIISALRLNLEKSAIIDPITTSSIRYLSIEQKRRYTLEVLSNL